MRVQISKSIVHLNPCLEKARTKGYLEPILLAVVGISKERQAIPMKRSKYTLRRRALSFFRVFAVVTTLSILFVGLGTTMTARKIKADIEQSLPPVQDLDRLEDKRITRFLSSDGKLIATLFKENYKPVKFDEMGDNIKNAVVAIEDARFYQHDGVDYRSVARAAFQNALAGRIQQGASTITMQLARHLYLSDEQSYERKIKEALLARKIEQEYGKDKILERYLNEVYFGAGSMGIGAASSRYFKKTPEQLTVAQAALMAGLIQSPTYLNPLTNHRGARYRQIQVLTAMRDQDYITDKQFREALNEARKADFDELTPEAGRPLLKYPYFTTYSMKKAIDSFGEKKVYEGGLTIRTTLDLNAQKHMESVLTDMLNRYGSNYHVNNGAAVLIENRTGHIKALVGGKNWRSGDRFNRATQALRQPGSTFKPLLYTAALERGYTQDTLLNDGEVKWVVKDGNKTKVWKPINSDGREKGKIPMREALRLSRNQATVDLAQKVGVWSLLDMAERTGIKSELPRVPSLALGTGEVTPLDMATAYSCFANQGTLREPTVLTLVTDAENQKLAALSHGWSRQATSPEVAEQTVDMMLRVASRGTGAAAFIPGLQIAGKTGTTDSFRDAWFVGFTPRYTLAVWMGNDDNSPTGHLYGGDLPARTWRKMMTGLPQGEEKTFDFLAKSPVKRMYCKKSHRLKGPDCEETYTETFRAPAPDTPNCTKCEHTEVFDVNIGEVELPDPLEVRPNYPQARPVIL